MVLMIPETRKNNLINIEVVVTDVIMLDATAK